jgi:phosphoglycolate phosphatase
MSGSATPRAVYLDLDGTLLGRGASLMRDGEGAVSIAGPRAVQACLRAGVEIVLMSGRRRTQVFEDARLLGGTAFIYEAGSCLEIDGEAHWLTGEYAPGEKTIAEQIELAGAPALLLEHYAGRLEYHEPWHVNREVSHLFRGLIDADEADLLLAERGHEGLRLVDNGVVSRRSPALAELPHVRGYHLVPRGASKARAVALHMRARGYAPEEVFAVGDSREDLACAEHVGSFWLVANAVERDPSIAALAAARANVRVAQASYGAGVYEAVVSALMGGGAGAG